jgi:hypothetical protein
MSSTNRGGKRIENDVYSTPAWCVHRLLEACILPGGRWLEPAAGDDAIVRAVNAFRGDVRWDCLDVRPGLGCECDDFLKWDALRGTWDVAITNPPYALAQEFIEHSMTIALNVVMLLRLNYLGSEMRAPFWHSNVPDVYVLPNRPAFVNGKTDSCEYAWFVWSHAKRTSGSIRVLKTTSKEVRHV